MSESTAKPVRNTDKYLLLNPLPKHFTEIQELCKRVYPFSKPWSLAQLESHRSYFPDGQLIVIEKATGKVVGLAFSLIIVWNDYSPQDNWQDFTSGGFFHNHNPRTGKTLYGAEVMVDPEYRGQGIGKMLYGGRRELADKYKLKRIRAGARLRGYSKFKDKLTPTEYVKAVIRKEIFDPTLSFQLNNGFKVIDVAPNYLFNDPESLGYAAVIEWLSPTHSTSKDLEKQKKSIDIFLSGERFMPEFLPRELRRIVRKATTTLGQSIRDIEGDAFFSKVESYREKLKALRTKKMDKKSLGFLTGLLEKEQKGDLFRLAHAFALQLEIMNVCEAAYRTWRLRHKSPPQALKKKLSLTYVLTAHPTEARTKDVVRTLHRIQSLLIEGIQNNFLFNDVALTTQMNLLWLQPFSKNRKPSVIDEAEYIYSLIFESDIFNYILDDKPGYDLRLRSWVGGDKDGHPGVNNDVMVTCLNNSRQYILRLISKKLSQLQLDLFQLFDPHHRWRNQIESVARLHSELKRLQIISRGDGGRVKAWIKKYRLLLRHANPVVKTHECILQVNKALEMFPALVLPIELREDSGLIQEALKQPDAPIRKMLNELASIAGPMGVKSYARGLVISHCESADDIANACRLVDLTCKSKILPAIPLFESREALIAGKSILKSWLKPQKNSERVHRHWNSTFEIMLGYSDSAKQVGVLSSRLLIAQSMHEVDRALTKLKVRPVFFHGSGGSVARGGGSIKEQLSWWSRSAVENPKMTIQGEMIQRQFATKEIMNSHCANFTLEALRRKTRKVRHEAPSELLKFEKHTAEAYAKLVGDSALLGRLLDATPYRYLDVLKIGSRPAKRPSENVSVDALRAIPWVLCWTQSRSLLPTWWGVGSAWKSLSTEDKDKLKLLFTHDAFFSSFVKTLSFSLAKVELDIWQAYFEPGESDELFQNLREEYRHALRFVHEVTGQTDLLWFRPWLGESIRLRSSHIHILNLIQILAMKKSDEVLLRETIVGIACGMLTTG